MNITPNIIVGQLAAKHPETTRVFERYKINYCCGGDRTLQVACEKLGLDIAAVQVDLADALVQSETTDRAWDNASPEELIEHILTVYHKPLKEELPRLEKLMNKVVKAHTDKAPDVLPELQSIFTAAKEELDQHLLKEENILFPMMLEKNTAMLSAPIARMKHEHEELGDALKRMRELTNNYEISPEACNTWRALWHGLEDFEKTIHQHLHLENNVLFVSGQ